jgi:SAM-dependent methyltransferase
MPESAATYQQLLSPVIAEGIGVANTIRFEDNESRLRLFGYAVHPGNRPSSIEIRMNGVPLQLDICARHDHLAQLFHLDNVSYIEATGLVPQDVPLLEFQFHFGGNPRTAGHYFFDRRRPALPEAARRARVHGTEEANSFDLVGCSIAQNIRLLLHKLGRPLESMESILDWGCGSGRVARYLFPAAKTATGIDIDRDNIEWCASNVGLPARFLQIALDPPTPLPAGHFDLIYAISVLTHLNRADQDAWLAELARIAKPGAILLLSIHSFASALTYGAPPEFFPQLDQQGFVDAGHDPTLGSFSPDTTRYRTTYHSHRFVRETWSRWFEVIEIQSAWVGGNQDLVVLKRT